jgi:hypothetical protein
MPFHLDAWLGGLGNQLFSLCIIYSLAKKHNTTFSVPLDTIHSQSYCPNTIVVYDIIRRFLSDGTYAELLISLPESRHKVVQFSHYTIKEDSANSTIILEGLPMMYSMFSEYIPILRNLINTRQNKDINALYIGMRTFTRESGSQWRIDIEYYKRALEYISSKEKKTAVHIYTDTEGSSSELTEYIYRSLGESCDITEFCGSTSDKSDIEHFYNSFNYDTFILCNSTFHYWGPIFSHRTKEVVYPEECEWYKHIAAPEWIRL